MSRNKDDKQGSALMRIFDIIMVPVTVCALGAMILVFVGGAVSPVQWWVPAFVVLGAPLIYLLNLMVTIYWVLRWNLLFVIPMVVLMAFAMWNVGAFVQLRFLKGYDSSQSDGLRIMSYNVHCFSLMGQDYDASLNAVAGFSNSQNPDVICFQEFQSKVGDTTGYVANLFQQWPYFQSLTVGSTPSDAMGTVIFSRYPITSVQSVISDHATGGALVVDLSIDGDTVRLYNCHLQTTSFNAVNNEEGLRSLFASDNTTERARSTTRVMRDSFYLRAPQADSVAANMLVSPYPNVLLGDLNSVPLSYTYNVIRGDMGDAFRDAGSGYGYTYRPMKKLLRIDYAFYDDDVYECVDYRSPDLSYSDHNPIIITIKKKI
ncbi:MAG: endonuclease/exonuclease/phosphatase family protein [Mucinivorans sp.]